MKVKYKSECKINIRQTIYLSALSIYKFKEMSPKNLTMERSHI